MTKVADVLKYRSPIEPMLASYGASFSAGTAIAEPDRHSDGLSLGSDAHAGSEQLATAFSSCQNVAATPKAGAMSKLDNRFRHTRG
jgi:hypothetical protein